MTVDQLSCFTAAHVPVAAEDPLYRLMREFRADKHENKIDLGIGAYRDENGKPWVLPVVKQVEIRLSQRSDTSSDQSPGREYAARRSRVES